MLEGPVSEWEAVATKLEKQVSRRGEWTGSIVGSESEFRAVFLCRGLHCIPKEATV